MNAARSSSSRQLVKISSNWSTATTSRLRRRGLGGRAPSARTGCSPGRSSASCQSSLPAARRPRARRAAQPAAPGLAAARRAHDPDQRRARPGAPPSRRPTARVRRTGRRPQVIGRHPLEWTGDDLAPAVLERGALTDRLQPRHVAGHVLLGRAQARVSLAARSAAMPRRRAPPGPPTRRRPDARATAPTARRRQPLDRGPSSTVPAYSRATACTASASSGPRTSNAFAPGAGASAGPPPSPPPAPGSAASSSMSVSNAPRSSVPARSTSSSTTSVGRRASRAPSRLCVRHPPGRAGDVEALRRDRDAPRRRARPPAASCPFRSRP